MNSNYSAWRSLARALVGSATTALLVSCGGPSTYNTSSNPPVAIAHAIGEATTSSNPLNITVRSRSQVTLTGNASDAGAGSIGTFSWAQTDASPGALAVTLLYLDASTVTFTAPIVAQDTSLHFTLTVTTAGNAASTADVVVLVKAVNDANQFLTPPTANLHTYKVALSTVEGLGPLAVPAESLAGDMPVCITESRTLVYPARDGTQHTVSLPPIQRDTSWSASIGGAANSFTSYSNPRVVFEIPSRNQDDLAVLFNNPVVGESASASAARIAQQLVASDIDAMSVSTVVTAGAGPCTGAPPTAGVGDKTLSLQILDQGGNAVGAAVTATGAGVPVSSAAFTPDLLVSQAPGAYETADTARAYYDAIDPTGAKTTLDDWLNANCFVSTAVNYGADAHSVYTNNFDLGFGRDMYFVACKSGAHVGDMASVVINYSSVEGAVNKLNPIIAVAMEYSAASDATTTGQARNQRRFPKFYVFAPDDRTGTFRRVSTANFDHRGEKFVPGACAMCHGGNLPTFAANFAHAVGAATSSYATIADPTAGVATGMTAPQLGTADVDSAFMPWDLDSFLYSDTDSSYVGLSIAPTNFTRAAQSPSLKALNQLTYCTYQPALESIAGAPVIDRFASSRRLVAQWYGGTIGNEGSTTVDTACAQSGIPTASLLPGSYDDTVTPTAWTAQTAPGAAGATSQTSDQLYHEVFARNCRSCHAQDPTPKYQFSSYADFISAFQATPGATPGATSSPGLGVQYVFQQGKMPLARLTMDRFWVNYAGGDSAAKTLATHIQEVNAETDLVNATTHDAIAPGAPVVYLNATGPGQTSAAQFTPYGGTATVINRFGGISLDASASYFIDAYSWSLCLISSTAGSTNCNPVPLVGAGSATPGFSNVAPGEYDLQLTANSSLGSAPALTYKLTVNQVKPSLAADCPTSVSNTTVASPTAFGPTATQDLSSCINGGDEPGNIANTLQILDPVSNTWVASVVEPTLTWTASALASCTPPARCSYSISFAFNGAVQGAVGTGLVTALSYRVTDYDGDSATGLLNLVLTDTLTAGGGTLTFQTAPASSYAIQVSSLSNVIVPASDAGVTLVVPTDFNSLPASITLPPPTGTMQFPLGGFIPSTPFSAMAGQTLAYAPPSSTFLNCDINGNDLALGQAFPAVGPACVGDTFWYYLVSGNGVTTSANLAKVTVKLKASTSFGRAQNVNNDIYTILSSTTNCNRSGCHAPTASPSAADGNIHWSVKTANILGTYNSIKGLNDSVNNPSNIDWTASDASGTPVSTPAQAALYDNVCDSTSSHAMTEFNLRLASADSCTTLLQWLAEGAHND